MKIVTSLLLTEPYEDWSRVRSPGRARRRMKYGYRQNVVHRERPKPDAFVMNGTIFMHPETYRVFQHMMAEQK